MCYIIKGRDVLNALIALKGASKLNEIVDYLFPSYDGSKTALLEVVKATLETGVEHGYIEEIDNQFRTEYIRANADHNQLPQTQETEESNKATSREAVKNIMSVNELNSSSTSVVMPKDKRIIRNLRSVSSDDDDVELRDHTDCCGSRYRSSRRARSRSGKRSKSYSRRRVRRRRR